jgi:hypothetical protein
MEYEFHQAPEEKVYVHKDNVNLFGEVIVITEEDSYTIDDFNIMSKEEHSELLESQ